jgi:hypothetical protein
MSKAGIAGLLIQTGFGGFRVRIFANGEKGMSVTKSLFVLFLRILDTARV